MPLYTARLANRDGSTDEFDLGRCDDHADAACKAQAALFVSLCAVSVELFAGGVRIIMIPRDEAPFRAPSEAEDSMRGAMAA